MELALGDQLELEVVRVAEDHDVGAVDGVEMMEARDRHAPNTTPAGRRFMTVTGITPGGVTART